MLGDHLVVGVVGGQLGRWRSPCLHLKEEADGKAGLFQLFLALSLFRQFRAEHLKRLIGTGDIRMSVTEIQVVAISGIEGLSSRPPRASTKTEYTAALRSQRDVASVSPA